VLRYSPTRFPATVVRTQTIGDFAMTETRYGAGAALATHAHEYACLVVVLDGHFHERADRRERTGAPGMVIVRAEGEPHSNQFNGAGGRCLNVELAPRWMAHVREHSRALTTSGAFTTGAFALLGRRLHDELAHGDDLSPLAVESIVLGILADAAREQRRASGTPPPWLLRAKARLDDDFVSRVTFRDVAGAAGVHPVHLAATFRRHFGQTMASYVRQLRIEAACRALVASEQPLADIALAAGFSDQSHFGRTFKRIMRVTPAEYRARCASR